MPGSSCSKRNSYLTSAHVGSILLYLQGGDMLPAPIFLKLQLVNGDVLLIVIWLANTLL